MGRLSRYKKVKSIDPFAKNGSWKSDVGDCSTLHRAKRRSKTVLKLKEQKAKKLQRRARGKGGDAGAAGRMGGGSNGWGDDDGFDLPPQGEDDFDINDLMGSLKKEKRKPNVLLETDSPAQQFVKVSSSRGASVASSKNSADQKKKNNNIATNNSKANAKNDGTLIITSKTPTREIIEAHANPSSHKRKNGEASKAAPYGTLKQEKKKAFHEKKKLKRRKRGGGVADDDDDEDYANQQALESMHAQSHPSTAGQKPAKKHLAKQDNYSDTMVARTVMDEPAERPPTFTSLPRGANKLAKNKKAKIVGGAVDDEDGEARSQRIRKEQREMEAMREEVMRRYAMLRESRRNGSNP